MAELVVTRFGGGFHFALDYIAAPPRSKDARWNEADRIAVPEGVTLSQAVALYRIGELKSKETP